jgi:hypothetical protein
MKKRASTRRKRTVDDEPEPETEEPEPRKPSPCADYPQRMRLDVPNGVVLIGSDGHYVPNQPAPTGHRAFVRFAKTIPNLRAVIYNGDAFDFGAISRFGRRMWDKQHLVAQELEAVGKRMQEIEVATKRGVPMYYTIANHDLRFETKLSNSVPAFEGVPGFRLRDHIGPRWQMGWAIWTNNGELVIKHRFKNGIHATHNSTMWAGKNICIGHLHSLKVTPFSDYNSTRYGIDCGTLADPYSPQFCYNEDNPRNHRSGFVVLTFRDGQLLLPEIVQVYDEAEGLVQWRGELLKV